MFKALLAGASLRDRSMACLGGLIGITATSLCCHLLLHAPDTLPWLVAPMGASAVLVFAVPASPLAQAWAVVGGNTVSALVGVAAARLVPDASLAAGVAVGGAILAMSLLRCLHPPGGAAALTAVIGGPAIQAAGFGFPFIPVAVNALILTIAGWAVHRFSGHSYPHRAVLAGPTIVPVAPHRISAQDLEAALSDLGETLDVSPADLDLLVKRAEDHAAARRRGA